MHNHIVLLGNGEQLLDIDLQRLVGNPHIVTVGINRTWKLIETDYLFCADPIILDEMVEQGFDFKSTKMKIYCSHRDLNRWIVGYSRRTKRRPGDQKDRAKVLSSLRDQKLIKNANRRGVIFTSSMVLKTLVSIYPKEDSTFYAVGMPLLGGSKHFWVGDDTVRNNRTQSWNTSRMGRQFNELKKIGLRGFRIISATPGSKLNQFFPSINPLTLDTLTGERLVVDDEEKTIIELRKQYEQNSKRATHKKGKRRSPRRREQVFDYEKVRSQLKERTDCQKVRSGNIS